MEDMEDFFVYAILIERSGRRSITSSNKQKNDISQGKSPKICRFSVYVQWLLTQDVKQHEYRQLHNNAERELLQAQRKAQIQCIYA